MMPLLIPVTALVLYKWYNYTPPLVAGRKSFTFYYMSSCPHCAAMYSTIRALGSNYQGIAVRSVEERSNRELEVHAFPTMVYRNADDSIEKYEGERTYAAITAFLDSRV